MSVGCDQWGFQHTLDDKNAGDSVYGYSNYGDLTRQKMASHEFNMTYDLAFDRNNNAWIATNNGVVVYNREGIRF